MNFSLLTSFVPTVYAQTSGCLPNPLGVSSVSDLLYLAVDIATYIGVILAVIFIIYAGFKYIAAQGNSEKIKEAHHFLLAVVIGIAILIGASAIVNVIKNTLTSAGVVNSSTFNTPSQSSSGCGSNTTASVSTTNTTNGNTTATPSGSGSGTGNFVGGGGSFGGGGAGGSY